MNTLLNQCQGQEHGGTDCLIHMDGSASHSLMQDALRVLEGIVQGHSLAAAQEKYEGARRYADAMSRQTAVNSGNENAQEMGEGVGVLCSMPQTFFASIWPFLNEKPHMLWGIAQCFMPRAPLLRAKIIEIVAKNLHMCDLRMLATRHVPMQPHVLSAAARHSMPVTVQILVCKSSETRLASHNSAAFEHALYVARRSIEKAVYEFLQHHKHDVRQFHVLSMSSRTLVYKGLLNGARLGELYPDLKDPTFTTRFIIYHQRLYASGTTSWRAVQPMRTLAATGAVPATEMLRQRWRLYAPLLMPELARQDKDLALQRILPVIDSLSGPPLVPAARSAALDNVCEFLLLNGYSLPSALHCLFPPQHHEPRPEQRFLAGASHTVNIASTDGASWLAFTHHAAHTCRYALTDEDVLIVAPAVGVSHMDSARLKEQGRVLKESTLFVDLISHRLIIDGEHVIRTGSVQGQQGYQEYAELSRAEHEKAENAEEAEKSEKAKMTHDQEPSFKKALIPATAHPLTTPAWTQAWTQITDAVLTSLMAHFAFTDIVTKRIQSMARKESNTEAFERMAFFTEPLAVFAQHPCFFSYFRAISGPFHVADSSDVALCCHVRVRQHTLLDDGQLPYILLENVVVSPASLQRLLGAVRAHASITQKETGEEAQEHMPVRLDAFFTLPKDMQEKHEAYGQHLQKKLALLRAQAEDAVKAGTSVLVLSHAACLDSMSAHIVPIPSVLVLASIHSHLLRRDIRHLCSLIAEVGDAYSPMHMVQLVHAGADVVCPFMAFSVGRAQCTSAHDTTDSAQGGQEEHTAVNKDSLGNNRRKISDNENDNINHQNNDSPENAHGNETKDASHEKKSSFNTSTATRTTDKSTSKHSPIATANDAYTASLTRGMRHIVQSLGVKAISAVQSGVFFESVGLDTPVVHEHFTGVHPRLSGIDLGHIAHEAHMKWALKNENTADSKPREHEEQQYSVERARLLKKALQKNSLRPFKEYISHCHHGSQKYPQGLHHMLSLTTSAPMAASQEPAEDILKRFVGMGTPQLNVLALRCLEQIHKDVGAQWCPLPQTHGYAPTVAYMDKMRMGHVAASLVDTEEIHISLVHANEHQKTHADMASLHDTAALIHSLRRLQPHLRICVMLPSSAGVGTLAAVLVKAGAHILWLCGSQHGSQGVLQEDYAHMLPWELALAEVQHVLSVHRLRRRVRLRLLAPLFTGQDVIKAILLGAEEFSVPAPLLVSLGCHMCTQCHDDCPGGLREGAAYDSFNGDVAHGALFLRYLAEDIRHNLEQLGYEYIDQLIGRADILEKCCAHEHKGNFLDVDALTQASSCLLGLRHGMPSYAPFPLSGLEHALLEKLTPQFYHESDACHFSGTVRSTDMSVGTHLSGEILRRSHEEDYRLPSVGTYTAKLWGSAGQCLGAFLTSGVTVCVYGEANDHVAKGLCGGVVVVTPAPNSPLANGHSGHVPALIGNAALYGALCGELYVAGSAGDHFAACNHGAYTVVEGLGDHACLHMHGGIVLVIGHCGKNLAQHMHGGTVYIYKPLEFYTLTPHTHTPPISALHDEDRHIIAALLRKHIAYTQSPRAVRLLEDWENVMDDFMRIGTVVQ